MGLIGSDFTTQAVKQETHFANVICLCFGSFIINLGFGVFIPFFPLYADNLLSVVNLGFIILGIAFQLGTMTSAFMLTRVFLAPAFGNLSDSIGRKPIILIGLPLYGFLWFGFAFSFDFWSLFLMRACQGVASAAVWPVGEALVVDSSKEDEIGKNIGYYMTSMQAGMSLGPFIGMILYLLFNSVLLLNDVLSYRLTFLSIGVFGFISAIFVILFVKDILTFEYTTKQYSVLTTYRKTAIAMFKKALRSPIFLVTSFAKQVNYRTTSLYIIYIIAIVNGFSAGMIFPILALYLDNYYLLDATQIAFGIGIAGIVSLLGGIIGGSLSDKRNRKMIVAVLQLTNGVLLLFFGFYSLALIAVLLYGLQQFFFRGMQSAFRAMQNDFVPIEFRGREFGLVQAMFNLGATIGPITTGWVYDLFYMQSIPLPFGLHYIGAGAAFGLSAILAIIASQLIIFKINYKDRILKTHRTES